MLSKISPCLKTQILTFKIFFLLAISAGIVGCVETTKRRNLIFKTDAISRERWLQIDKECEFEAQKAVIPIKASVIAEEQYRKIYILCVESKGGKFIGFQETE